MNLTEITAKLNELDNWSLETNSIKKDFIFNDFKESMDFVNKVAEIAEKNSHHPDISIFYSRVRLSLTTHELKSLSEKDFAVAKEIDKLTS